MESRGIDPSEMDVVRLVPGLSSESDYSNPDVGFTPESLPEGDDA